MILIPMAGLSARFFRAGYTLPKYQLDVHGASLFTRVVEGFSACFEHETLAFVVRDIYDTPAFVERELRKLGLSNFEIVVLPTETRGQAETVHLGLRGLSDHRLDENLTIFNIDTIRPGFRQPDLPENVDGYLEVFRGEGEHWSFVKPEDARLATGRVLQTTEKERISNLCSSGLYGFRDGHLFNHYYEEAERSGLMVRGELYVAPIYNLLLRDGLCVHYYSITEKDILFCGTPDEYLELQTAAWPEMRESVLISG